MPSPCLPIITATAYSRVKPETASGVKKLTVASCRGFAANDARVHQGCSDAEQNIASDVFKTDHEHIAGTDVVHMNGRIYDSAINRFLQPDIVVQAATFALSYNRYSYVLNNPINFIDPSGYFFDSGGNDDDWGWMSDTPSNNDPTGGDDDPQLGGKDPAVGGKDPANPVPEAGLGNDKINPKDNTGPKVPDPEKNGKTKEQLQAGFPIGVAIVIAARYIGKAIGKALGKSKSKGPDKSTPAQPKAKTVDDLKNESIPGRRTKGRTEQYDKPGGPKQANEDFDALDPKDVKDIPGGRTGTLDKSKNVNVREKSTDGRPTLEVQDGKNKTKFRYDN